MPSHVVIAGGGFGGLYAANALDSGDLVAARAAFEVAIGNPADQPAIVARP